MSHATKIAIVAAFIAALGGIWNAAAARGSLYPLTRCGPGLAYLCPIQPPSITASPSTRAASRWCPFERPMALSGGAIGTPMQ
jgi:hypothetical protein